MKRFILSITILIIGFSSFAQQKSYGNKVIVQWTLEKFPLHYTVKPAKALTYRNSNTNKLEKYQEFNQLGQPDGLTVIMSDDGIYPFSASYTYKGEGVYSVTFFPNSNKAQVILNYDTNSNLDGYKINRTLKSSGGYTEEINKFINGELVETNGVKTTPISILYKDSLLDGPFKFESSQFVIEGVAEKGKLKKIKQFQEKSLMCEITFLKDSIKIKESGHNEGYTYETLPIISNPTITNSKSYCLEYGNYNGFPYFVFPKDFDVRDLKEIVPTQYADSFKTEQNYVNELLDGRFQYRQYIKLDTYSERERFDIFGKAEKGKLIGLILAKFGYGDITYTQYTFNGDSIRQYELDSKTGNQKSLIGSLKIEYPVLLTNSKSLGGTYSLLDSSWDHSINNPNNTLGIPFKREGRLLDNKYGYAYFSPSTFDIENYISILTTKQKN